MRLMGLDYGDKTIGVAVSDALGWTAQGVDTIQRRNCEADLIALRTMIEQYDVAEIVVGLPKNMNGSIGERGELTIQFADELASKLNMPVHLWDERLTTMAAERTLLEADVSRRKRKKVIDKMAATIILQGYMDANNRK